jgi:hypothetical protein
MHFQIDGLPQEFPALKTSRTRPGNSPVQLTALIEPAGGLLDGTRSSARAAARSTPSLDPSSAM